MTTNNQKLLIALTQENYITATKSKILDPTFSSTSELTITNIKTKKTTTHQCTSKFDQLHTFDTFTLGILENSTAELYTDQLVMTHEITAPYAFAYNSYKKMLAISNPLTLINMQDLKIYNPGDFKHNFKCLSWNNKVHHILATISENKIVILDLKNKKEVVNVALETYKIGDVSSLMWHWSELTSLIIGGKDGTFKINLSDNTTVKISELGEKVIFSDYLVCTDYKTVEFYDKELVLVVSKEMNICDIDVKGESIAISYMDRKPEIIKKARFVEKYGANKQINLFYINNKMVIALKNKYKIRNNKIKIKSEKENKDDCIENITNNNKQKEIDDLEKDIEHLSIVTKAVEGQNIDIEKYIINEEDDLLLTIKVANIKKMLEKECFTNDEYKEMDSALVLLLSEYYNDFAYISENIEINKWANAIYAINKSHHTEKKKYYEIIRQRLEKEEMKEEAMIVCVYAQDYVKLQEMQIQALEMPTTVEKINTFFQKFGIIIEKFKALNVTLESELYKNYLTWLSFNEEEDYYIEDKSSKDVSASKKTNDNVSQKASITNNNYKNENVKNNKQSNNNFNSQHNQNVFVPKKSFVTNSGSQTSTPSFIPSKIASSFLPPKQNVVQQNQSSSAYIPSPGTISRESMPPIKPKLTYGQINQQQVKNVMGNQNLQRPTGSVQPNLGSVQNSNTSFKPNLGSVHSSINNRPSQPITPPTMNSTTIAPPSMVSSSIAPPTPNQRPPPFTPKIPQTVGPPRQQSPMSSVPSPHSATSSVSTRQPEEQNNLPDKQKQEFLVSIQKKVNYLITESSKKNGFFHKNKISSSMKRLQFYEINKDGFPDALIICLHELLEMIDEEGNVNMLEKFKAKLNEMNGMFGNNCGFDVFGLGLLGLYQVVLSEKK